jgi:hypothetical protein
VRISQTIAPLVTVDADTPALDHGDREDSPTPVPNAKRISDSAEVANAPANTAAQETADDDASFLPEYSGRSD